jgi:hypothetical protein
MALIYCKECTTEVSDKALNYPKCGAKLRKPKRTIFGKIIKYTFIGFNLLMLYWMVSGIGAVAETINASSSEANQAGVAIGTGLGAMMILFIWGISTYP